MTQSIKKRVQALQSTYKVRNIKALFDAMLVDATALETYNDALAAFQIADAIIVPTVTSKGSTPENVATTAFSYQIDGASLYKAAVAAGTAFTDADTVNTAAGAPLVWGAWLVQISSAGTITTHSVGANQVYTTEALAIAAIPVAEAGNVAVGYVTVQCKASTAWTAGTDSLDATDATGAFFYSATTDVPVPPSPTIAA